MSGTRAVRQAALRSCRYLLVLTLLASAINLAMATTALAAAVPTSGIATAQVSTAAVDTAVDGHESQSPGGNETRIVKKVKGFVVSTPPQRPAPTAVPPTVRAVAVPATTHLSSALTRGAGNRRGPPGPTRTHASDS